MKFLSSLNVLFLFVSLIYPNLCNAPDDPLKGKDLFALKPTQMVSWLGYIKSDRSQSINNIPMFILESVDTYAKVICVPTSPLHWNAKFKGKSSAEKVSINKTLVQAVQDRSLNAKQFNVFAFVQQVVEGEGRLKNNQVSDLKFPSRVFVYSSSGDNWIKISEKLVLNAADYGKFQYQIAKSTL